jgi:hypothetical protein
MMVSVRVKDSQKVEGDLAAGKPLRIFPVIPVPRVKAEFTNE